MEELNAGYISRLEHKVKQSLWTELATRVSTLLSIVDLESITKSLDEHKV